MKFLIQKVNGVIVHDFSLALLKSKEYHSWLRSGYDIKIKYINTGDKIPIEFKPIHKDYVPIGSVEFVNEFLNHFYGNKLRPINVPSELISFAGRSLYNGNADTIASLPNGKWFVKSNDNVKSFSEVLTIDDNRVWKIPRGDYQISSVVDIKSEWRAFVYDNELVGLSNYSGDFKIFPNVNTINKMIEAYESAPIAYTLDVGINSDCTFVIECHQFISVGLYNFSDYRILPKMFNSAFKELINK